MSGTDPTGRRQITTPAPDGGDFGTTNAPYNWPQADRERGAIRKAGSRPFETAFAVVGGDGAEIGSTIGIAELIYEIRQLRKALTLSEVATDLGDLDT